MLAHPNFRIADDTASETDCGFECFANTGVNMPEQCLQIRAPRILDFPEADLN